MKMIIDELVTILGLELDPANIEKIQKFEKALGTVVKQVGIVSASLVAAASGAAAFAARMNTTSSELAKLGQLTGLNTDEIQNYSLAAVMAGGNVDSLRNDLVGLNESLNPALPGQFNKGILMLAASTGVALGPIKNAFEGLDAINKMLQAPGMSQSDKFQWAKEIGLSADTALLVMQKRDEYLKTIKTSERIGSIISPKDLENAFAFTKQLNLLELVVKNIGQKIASVASPAMKMITGDTIALITQHKEFIELGLQYTIDGIIDGFARFGKMIGGVKNIFSGWVDKVREFFPESNKFLEFFKKIDIVSNVVFIALTALVGVLATMGGAFVVAKAPIIALGFVIGDFIKWLQGQDSAIGTSIGWLQKFANEFEKTHPQISKTIAGTGSILKNFGRMLKDEFVDALKLSWQGLKLLSLEIGIFSTSTAAMIESFFGGTDFSRRFTKMAADMKKMADDRRTLAAPFLDAIPNFNLQRTSAAPMLGPRQSKSMNENVINFTQNINGENVIAIAHEAKRGFSDVLNQTYPGNYAPVVN